MKTVWLSALILTICHLDCLAANHINISAQLDTFTHGISGWVTVTWPSLETPTDDLHFRLHANLRLRNGKISKVPVDSNYTVVDSIWVGGRLIQNEISCEGTDLSFPTDHRYNAGDSLTVRMHFRTHITERSHNLARLFASRGEYLLDGWFPMPAPRRNGEWEIIKYGELSELVADFFEFELQFEAPVSLKVAGAGLVGADTTGEICTHSFLLSQAHDFALYLSPNLEYRQYIHGLTSIHFYASADAQYLGDEISDVCGSTLDIMSEWVGQYPYSELTIVMCELGFFGGIELPRMIVSSVPLGSRFLGTRDVVMIHEVIHQWFYGTVNSNQAVTPWMDEAVTDYFTAKVSQAMYGERSFLDRWGFTLDYAGLQRLQGLPHFDFLPITLPADQYATPGRYVNTVYSKGANVLRTLFGHLSPVNESEFWRKYFGQYAFAAPTQSDFTSLLSENEPYRGTGIALDILNSTSSIDYAIIAITNEPAGASDDSGQVVDTPSNSVESIRSTVSYSLQNPLGLPTEIRLCFDDGTQRDTLISPVQGFGELIISGNALVVSSEIDPENRVALDENLLNNSLTLTSNGSATRLFSGITFLVESFISYVWGL